MRSETTDRRGQVAAIAGVIAVGIAVLALASAQAFLVPQQNEATELDHVEKTQEQLSDVRTAILDSARTSAGQSSTVDLGPEYRNRFLLQNPAPPSGQFSIERTGTASISNAVAVNPETRDFWSGETRTGYPVGSVVYRPSYNYVEGAGETVYENSVLYTQREGQTTVEAGETLVDGTDLNLVFLDGNRTLSSSQTVTLQPTRLSASDNRVPVESVAPDEPVVIRVPTELSEDRWRELLDGELASNGGHLVSPPRVVDGELVLELEGGVEYGLSMSRVGYQNSKPVVPAYITVVDVDRSIAESASSEITVEVRDQYNNPVSGVDLRGRQPTVGSLLGPGQDAVGTVTATTDEDGRATFVYRSPENVAQPSVLSQFSVVADGIPGPKGEVAFEVSAGDTPEPISPSERGALVTAVQPDPSGTALTAPEDGEFVRVSVPAEFDPAGYSLDVENADRSVVNTVRLDQGGLLAGLGGPTAEVYEVGDDDLLGSTVSLETLLATGERESLDVYVVGSTVTDLDGFADAQGLRDGDVVVSADATGLVFGGLSDADGGVDSVVDVLDDRRGTVLVRDADGRVEDSVSYRSGPAGTIDEVVSRDGTADGAEYVALSFDRATDLTGATLAVDSNGVNETVPLDEFGTGVSGPRYVVGTGVDRDAFAADRGVSTDRVRSVTALAGRDSLAFPDDVLGAYEGEVTLVVGGETVDRAEYEERALATIDDAVPVRDGQSTDEYVELTFDGVDTTRWTLTVDDGTTAERLDLASLAGTTAGTRGPVYLVGDDVDPATFADERGVTVDRVFRLRSLASSLRDADVLADGGARLTLRDGTGDTVDTFVYDGADAGRLTEVDSRRGAESDEFARLAFGQSTDTTDWTLTVERADGTLETVSLSGIDDVADGPVYLVGDGTDVLAFASAEGVAASQVVRYRSLDGDLPTDLFPGAGASLTLRDADGRTVDSLSYAGAATTGEITAVSPLAGGDSAREFTRLTFERPVDTSAWSLATESSSSDSRRTLSYDLSVFGPTLQQSAGPVYLVGDAVDVADFADARGVSPDRIARFSSVASGATSGDALPDVESSLPYAGAELELVRDDGVVVDREAYGSDARPKADSTVDVGDDSTDQTVYRETDANGDYIDTDRAEDWYFTDADPDEGSTPAQAGPISYVDGSVGTTTDGTLQFEVRNEGETAVTAVGFAVETGLATALDAGTDRELFVVAATTGYVDAEDDGFATSGTTYPFESPEYAGVEPVVDGGGTASLDLGELRNADGAAIDAGSLVATGPGDADVSVTLVLSDGTQETFYFRQRNADLSVNVTAEREVVAVGAPIDFEVTLTNAGPGRAAGPVTVTGLPGRGLAVDAATPSVGSYDAETGEWTLPDGLTAGETVTFAVEATATEGNVGDTVEYGASVSSSGSPDDTASNDADAATVSIGGADLEVTQTIAPEPVEQGETTTTTVTVENLGPAGNSGPIVVSESLPDGLTYVSDDTEVGTYESDTGEWTIPDGLEAGETVTLEVVARAELSAPTDVTASVADSGPMADGDDSNDVATVTVEAGPCSDYVLPGESVLLYETFETDGSTDEERLENSAFRQLGGAEAGVDSSTSAAPDDCTQSAYHADGAGSLVSEGVDTSGHEQIVVGYWVREGDAPFSEDPQAGEDLIVEYLDADGDWVEIEEFNASAALAPADGSAIEREYVLPADAATHDDFVLRFRQDDGDRGVDNPDTVFDYWHVDNVYVLGSDSTGEVTPVVSDVAKYCDTDDDDDDDDVCDTSDDDGDGAADGDPSFEVSFGYESTYDRPVALGSGDENDVTPNRYDPDLPSVFSPQGDDDAVVVPTLEPGNSVTWTLAGQSATAYGRVADLSVSMTTDDTDGQTIEGQELTYEVTVTNEGDPTGSTDGDSPGPVVLDVAIPEAADEGSLSTITSSTGTGSFDADTDEWTLPDGLDAGESATLEVLVKIERPRETTSAVAIEASSTADTVPANDEASLTIDPFPVTCRDVAYVGPDGRTVNVLTPRGDSRTLGTASDTIDILGPYTDLDGDDACEAVYIAGGDGTARNLFYVDDDGREVSISGGADVSKSALAAGDIGGNGVFSVFYADNTDENLAVVNVTVGEGGEPVLADGSEVESDSGGVGYTDVTGDGVNDTLYVDSRSNIGVVDGTDDSTFTISVPQIGTAGGGAGHHTLGPMRPAMGPEPKIPVLSGSEITLTDPDGNTQVVYSGADVAPSRFTLRDWDYDGEWEYLFLDSNGRVRVYDPGTGQSTALTGADEAQTATGVQ